MSSTYSTAGKLWPRPVSGDDRDAVKPRRGQPRPGRWGRWRRLLRWLKAVAWSLAIVGSPVVAVLWLYQSSRFALQEVAVVYGDGEAMTAEPDRVAEAWVRQAVAPFAGRNLLRLPLAEVAGRIEAHPWVQSVGLSKELPSRLGVRIVERREVALLSVGVATADREISYLDRDGEIIAPVEGAAPDLVVVELAGSWRRPGPALALLRELEAATPRWLGGLETIVVLEENDFVLSTADLPYPLWVRAGTAAGKFRRLQELLPVIMAHTSAGTAIDLRFEQRIIIQPSAGRGTVGSLFASRIAAAASGRNT